MIAVAHRHCLHFYHSSPYQYSSFDTSAARLISLPKYRVRRSVMMVPGVDDDILLIRRVERGREGVYQRGEINHSTTEFQQSNITINQSINHPSSLPTEVSITPANEPTPPQKDSIFCCCFCLEMAVGAMMRPPPIDCSQGERVRGRGGGGWG